MPINIDLLRSILELGWPAIVTVFFGYLAMQYIADQRAQIAKLWDRVIWLETELDNLKHSIDTGKKDTP